MHDRALHKKDIRGYLQRHVSPCAWEFTLPGGSGHETYFAHGGGRIYFVKVGASAPQYEILAAEGLTPQVVSSGYLEDGAPILIQLYIAGRRPSPRDYQLHLDDVAIIIRKVHENPSLRRSLPAVSFNTYRKAALQTLIDLRSHWELYKPEVPDEAAFVDDSLDGIAQFIPQVAGSGLVAAHNDICNANWILAEHGKFYLIDLEGMSWNDPAYDVGPLLWWYYPPSMRQRFLEIAGYPTDDDFRLRMQINMAMHSLRILLPRKAGFDNFNPLAFGASLNDLRAVLGGRQNPQGYDKN